MLQVIALEGLPYSGSFQVLRVIQEQLLRQGEALGFRDQWGNQYHLYPHRRILLPHIFTIARGTGPEVVRSVEWIAQQHDLHLEQMYLPTGLNEPHLRDLRKLEEAGLIEFHAYLLHTDPLRLWTAHPPEWPELNRTRRISQNRPLGAAWLKSDTAVEWMELAQQLLDRCYDQLTELPKVTNAATGQQETPLSQIMRQHYSQVKGREIHWTPKRYVTKAMDEERWGVEPAPHPLKSRLVLCTGTGRSGTTWFSKAMELIGLDVRHQANGVHGCSGAEFAADADWYPWFPVYGGGDCANVGERRSDYLYDHVFHGVRHPLWCIPSLQKNYAALNAEFWVDVGVMPSEVMAGSSLLRNAYMYYGINRYIDDSHQAEYRFQIEQVEQAWPTLMHLLELDGIPWPKLGKVNYATSWGQYEPLTWSELEQGVGLSLASAIREQARSYGYEV